VARDRDVKESIIAAGVSAFRRLGYHGTSVNDVVAQAGVSKGGFYHYFPSKEALFVEVMERVLLAGEERESPAQGKAAIEQRLRQLFLIPLSRDADYLPVLFDAIKTSKSVRGKVAELFGSHLRRCEALLRNGQEVGAIRESLDCASWAFQIVASIEGAFLLSAVSPDSTGTDRLPEALEKLFETLWRVARRIEI